jgi:hypothetical protein
MTQASEILSYLRRGNTITPMTALRRFNCFRLGARIFGLRQEGHKIKTEIVRTSTGKNFARYSLCKRAA